MGNFAIIILVYVKDRTVGYPHDFFRNFPTTPKDCINENIYSKTLCNIRNKKINRSLTGSHAMLNLVYVKDRTQRYSQDFFRNFPSIPKSGRIGEIY